MQLVLLGEYSLIMFIKVLKIAKQGIDIEIIAEKQRHLITRNVKNFFAHFFSCVEALRHQCKLIVRSVEENDENKHQKDMEKSP